MREEITVTKIYKFDELPEDAKKLALDENRDINVEYQEWSDYTIEAMTTIAKFLGIEIDNIYFRGFWSQGDGACFVGTYSYNKGWGAKLEGYAPTETVFFELGERLQDLQSKYFYKLCTKTETNGILYSHSRAVTTSLLEDDFEIKDFENVENELGEIMRDFMDEIYSRLELEHNYLTSDEAIIDCFNGNDYEFTLDGKIV